VTEPLFALDVGTRKVCGILLEAGPDGPALSHVVLREHPGRAMLDGQVHLIEAAAKVIAEVKRELERLSGRSLEQAHVAVAGRSLALSRQAGSFKTGTLEPLTRAQVLAMELQAVKEARSALADPRAQNGAYCVGYNLLSMRLDGVPMQKLEGHRGEVVELEVMATFLPRLALDALQAALRSAGLSAASLTLEPIAAVQLAVPPELRRLNLGFVDIGAGTSDIAITREGRVDGYAMVDVAGDEVTERLSDAFLLDFSQAERLKRECVAGGSVQLQDLFGGQRSIASADAWREMAPAIDWWADRVAEAMVKLNGGRSPQAVLLAGGGSQTPGLVVALADALGLTADRVGRRPTSLQVSFAHLPEEMREPWAVTPLGIAASAWEKRGLPFAHFKVNGDWVQALNLNQRFSAFDALVASGREMAQFHGRPGLACSYTFNGQLRTAKGSMGSGCKLYVNGVEAALDSELKSGDSLTFINAVTGEDGRLTFAEALEREGLSTGSFSYNGEERPLPIALKMDGAEVTELDGPVPDRAKLQAVAVTTLQSLLEREGVDLSALIHREIAVSVDGEPRVLSQRNYSLRLEGREAPLESPVLPGAEVDFEPGSSYQERVRDVLAPSRPAEGMAGAFKIKLNGEWAPLDKTERVLMNGREVSLDEFLIDGATIEVERGRPCHNVGEALRRLGLEAWMGGDRLQVTLNGRVAAAEDPLKDGDAVDLSLREGARSR
jgi:Ethanolamine utilization protein EutJ (predicted chaperonin)